MFYFIVHAVLIMFTRRVGACVPCSSIHSLVRDLGIGWVRVPGVSGVVLLVIGRGHVRKVKRSEVTAGYRAHPVDDKEHADAGHPRTLK